ncbi:ROK family transcriptional regulator [Occultella gossypii]|uniref:ROK family transcriptional regulator n=1 Tax=Occultella gossypii TaxID=2800820 RepID=A0ABS7S5S4_9MICO|nr:ROK family transcriptional regulator [Occultella gossypii]MBZ2195432.1 ROK family transcriptional regulator [Occultella gossypii]
MPLQRRGPIEGTPAEAAVLTTVFAEQPIARTDIARRIGLSSAAVTRATQPLLDAGCLEYADAGAGDAAQDPTTSRMGRPRRPVRIAVDYTGTFGLKLTHEEVVGVLVDFGGRIRGVEQRPLAGTDVDAAIETVVEIIGALDRRARKLGFTHPADHVGLSVSGDVDHATGRVRYSPFLDWREVDLGARVSKATGKHVVVENDVKALATAEQWFGYARGLDDFALVTIGTGIGSALVVDGALIRGAHSVAGEIGHLPVGDPAVLCRCGGHGCVEAEASTETLIRRCREAAGDPDLTLAEAVERARSGDTAIEQVFVRAGHLIGLAIASLANIIGPAQVIVSGEGLTSYDFIESAIRAAFVEQTFGAAQQTQLHLQPLPLDEWARGAAAVAIEELAFPSRLAAGRRVFGGSHA